MIAPAIEMGKLQWQPGTKDQPAVAEIQLQDTAEIDPAGIRARMGVKESYGVAGLTYLPAYGQVQVKPARRPDGKVVLRLEGLPADVPRLDLLVTLHYKLKMALAEYRVDLRKGAVEVPALVPGAQGASLAPEASPLPRDKAEPLALARPAALAASVAAARVSVLAAPVAPATAVAGADEASAVLQAWAAAWSRRDVDAYLAAYAPTYAGRGAANPAEWREQRRTRIQARKTIEVKLSDLAFRPEGPHVVATFTQSYRADGLRETTRKRVVLAQAAGRWLITEEAELR